MMNSVTNSRRQTDAETAFAAERLSPPLTSTEQILRAGLVLTFVILLSAEAWLLWHAWSLWG